MSGNDKKVLMAWALGNVAKIEDREKPAKMKLGDINPEWAGYELVRVVRNERKNDYCGLWYDGKFGVEQGFVPLLDVYSGFDLNHIIHLLIQTIDCHQAELREEETC